MSDTRAITARPPPWRDARVHRVVLQLAFLALVVVVGSIIAGNLTRNLRRQGISTSFDYLGNTTGFTIQDSSFNPRQDVLDALQVGIKNTLALALFGIFLALVIGVVVGVARLSRNWLVRQGAALYVEAIRNVPVLVLIIFFNQAVILQLPSTRDVDPWLGSFVFSNGGIAIPSVRRTDPVLALVSALLVVAAVAVGVAWWRTRRSAATGAPHHRIAWAAVIVVIGSVVAFLGSGKPVTWSVPEVSGFQVIGGLRMSPNYAALLVGLVLYTASHIAEIVRGAVQAVSRGQTEAAFALGLSNVQRLRFIILPQAFRIMVPPLGNQFLNLTKNTSLAVAIGFPEVMSITGTLISNGQPAPQSIVVVMAIYLTFSLAIATVTNLVNRRLQVVTR